jgi:hypothetical protein
VAARDAGGTDECEEKNDSFDREEVAVSFDREEDRVERCLVRGTIVEVVPGSKKSAWKHQSLKKKVLVGSYLFLGPKQWKHDSVRRLFSC